MEVMGEASDGASAIRLAKCLRPDVVLMDVVMPGIDGIEATRQIVLNCPQVRVVGLSVHDSPVCVARMLEAGASAYMLKDCDLEKLVRVIRHPGQGQVGGEDEGAATCSSRSAGRPSTCQLR